MGSFFDMFLVGVALLITAGLLELLHLAGVI